MDLEDYRGRSNSHHHHHHHHHSSSSKNYHGSSRGSNRPEHHHHGRLNHTPIPHNSTSHSSSGRDTTKSVPPPPSQSSQQSLQTKQKTYKLLVDPGIVKTATEKVYRFDGITPPGFPDYQVRDPRSRNRLWKKESNADLPVPRFKIDQNYIGHPPPVEVTLSNLNDNIDKTFLKDIVTKYGHTDEAIVFHHPVTNRHLGLARLTFETVEGAKLCVERMNNTSVMGKIVTVFLDPFGKLCRENFQKLTEEKKIEKEQEKEKTPEPEPRKKKVVKEEKKAESREDKDSDRGYSSVRSSQYSSTPNSVEINQPSPASTIYHSRDFNNATGGTYDYHQAYPHPPYPAAPPHGFRPAAYLPVRQPWGMPSWPHDRWEAPPPPANPPPPWPQDKHPSPPADKHLDLDTRIEMLLKGKIGGSNPPTFLNIFDSDEEKNEAEEKRKDSYMDNIPLPPGLDELPSSSPTDQSEEPLSNPPSPFLSKQIYLDCHKKAIEKIKQARQLEADRISQMLDRKKLQTTDDDKKKVDDDDDRMSLSSLSSGDEKIEEVNQPYQPPPPDNMFSVPPPPLYTVPPPPPPHTAYPWRRHPGPQHFPRFPPGFVPPYYRVPNNFSVPPPNYRYPPPPKPPTLQEATIRRVLDKIIPELKQILKRDCNKKMIENLAFKAFERWWDEMENLSKSEQVAGVSTATKSTDELQTSTNVINSILQTGIEPMSYRGLGFRGILQKLPSFKRKRKPPSPKPVSPGSSDDEDEAIVHHSDEEDTGPVDEELRKQQERVTTHMRISSSSSESSEESDDERSSEQEQKIEEERVNVIQEEIIAKDTPADEKQIDKKKKTQKESTVDIKEDSRSCLNEIDFADIDSFRERTPDGSQTPLYKSGTESSSSGDSSDSTSSSGSSSSSAESESDSSDTSSSSDSDSSDDEASTVDEDTLSKPKVSETSLTDRKRPRIWIPPKREVNDEQVKIDEKNDIQLPRTPLPEEKIEDKKIESPKKVTKVRTPVKDKRKENGTADKERAGARVWIPSKEYIEERRKDNGELENRMSIDEEESKIAKEEYKKAMSDVDMEEDTNTIAMEHSYCRPNIVAESVPLTDTVSHDHGYIMPVVERAVKRTVDVPEERKKEPLKPIDDNRMKLDLIKPTKRPAPAYKPRKVEEEMGVLYNFLTRGLDMEDIKYLRLAYEDLLESNIHGFWLSYTQWVDHPPTDPGPAKRMKWDERPAHKSGSARTEGFYKLNRKQKLKQHKMNYSQESIPLRHYEENIYKVEKSGGGKMVAISREARSNQRRLLTEFGAASDSDLLKFNVLKFRKKQLKFAKSGIHDWGLFAMEPIAADEMVIEYVGQMIRPSVADLRERQYEATGIGSSYLFRIDLDTIIDATKCGNLARFINHSCNPNCYAKIITIENHKKIVIYSKQAISVNEEITYDYKFPIEEEKIACLCGAQGCHGTLN